MVDSVVRETALFDAVFAFAPLGSERNSVTLAAEGGGERVDGEMVSGEYFRGLGVSPALGRVISIDDEPAAAQVAVISHAYWTRRFGAEPGVVHLGERVCLHAAVRLDRAGSHDADTDGADVDNGRVCRGLPSGAPPSARRSGSSVETGLTAEAPPLAG